jgi:hypothetical protein
MQVMIVPFPEIAYEARAELRRPAFVFMTTSSRRMGNSTFCPRFGSSSMPHVHLVFDPSAPSLIRSTGVPGALPIAVIEVQLSASEHCPRLNQA